MKSIRKSVLTTQIKHDVDTVNKLILNRDSSMTNTEAQVSNQDPRSLDPGTNKIQGPWSRNLVYSYHKLPSSFNPSNSGLWPLTKMACPECRGFWNAAGHLSWYIAVSYSNHHRKAWGFFPCWLLPSKQGWSYAFSRVVVLMEGRRRSGGRGRRLWDHHVSACHFNVTD